MTPTKITADRRLCMTVAAIAAAMIATAAAACHGDSPRLSRIFVRSPNSSATRGNTVRTTKMTPRLYCNEPRWVEAVKRSEILRSRFRMA